MYFLKIFKVFSEKLAEWVFPIVIVSEGDKETALRKWGEVNFNEAVFFPNKNHPASI